MPLVVSAADTPGALGCRRPSAKRLQVAQIAGALLDGQLRKGFQPSAEGLDPLLAGWQQALGPGDGILALSDDDSARLISATSRWREALKSRLEGRPSRC